MEDQSTFDLMPQRSKDNPFSRYETYAMVQRPAQIKYHDLKERRLRPQPVTTQKIRKSF